MSPFPQPLPLSVCFMLCPCSAGCSLHVDVCMCWCPSCGTTVCLILGDGKANGRYSETKLKWTMYNIYKICTHGLLYSGVLQLDRNPVTALWMQSLISCDTSWLDPSSVLVSKVLRWGGVCVVINISELYLWNKDLSGMCVKWAVEERVVDGASIPSTLAQSVVDRPISDACSVSTVSPVLSLFILMSAFLGTI